VAIFLSAGFLVRLVAGGGFGPSVEVLQVLAFALVGTFVIGARGYALLSLGRLRAMLLSNAIAFAIVIGAGVPLIVSHGALGAAITMTAAELVLGLSYEFALTRARPDVRAPFGFLTRVVGAALIACVPTAVLRLPPLGAGVIGVSVYCVLALAFRVVPSELRDALRPSQMRSARGPAA
jgi:O-antigen/teichoic acid export membrane protein